MADTFVFGNSFVEDLQRGYGTVAGVTLPDGSVETLNKIGIHSFLGLAYLSAADFPGTEAGSQISEAVQELPSTGGVIDCRGLIGNYDFNSTAVIDRPVVLLLGATTFLVGTSLAFDVSAALNVVCDGRGVTTFKQTISTATVFSVAAVGAFQIRDCIFTSTGNQTAGAAISMTGVGSTGNGNSVIRNNVFDSQWISVNMANVAGIRITSNQFQNARSRSVLINNTVDGDSGDNFILYNSFSGPDPYTAGTAAIEWIAGGGLMVSSNKFFLHDSALLVNWNTAANTSQLSVTNNHFEAQKYGGGGATIRMARTNGSLSGVSIIGNYITASGHNVLDVPANATLWMAQMVVASNNVLMGDTAIAFNVTGFAAAQGLFIGNHVFGNGSGSQAFNFGLNLASMRVWGNMGLGCTVPDVFLSGLRGNYEPDMLGLGITNDVPLTTPLLIPKNTSLAARNSTNSANNRMIGTDSADHIMIGADASIITELQGPLIISAASGVVPAAEINYVQRLTVALVPSAVAPNTSSEEAYTVPGLDGQDTVIVQPPAGGGGIGLVGARCGTDVLALTWMNATAGSLAPPAGNYAILAMRVYPV